jgi:hypothetical protein
MTASSGIQDSGTRHLEIRKLPMPSKIADLAARHFASNWVSIASMQKQSQELQVQKSKIAKIVTDAT